MVSPGAQVRHVNLRFDISETLHLELRHLMLVHGIWIPIKAHLSSDQAGRQLMSASRTNLDSRLLAMMKSLKVNTNKRIDVNDYIYQHIRYRTEVTYSLNSSLGLLSVVSLGTITVCSVDDSLHRCLYPVFLSEG